MAKFEKPDAATIKLLADTGHEDYNVAVAAQREFAKAFETPLRKVILSGDILDGIYSPIPLEKGDVAEYPTDLIAPGMEGEHVAYTSPAHGRIPEKTLESDYISIPTYHIASSIDWLLKISQEAKWDVTQRAMEIFKNGFVKKMNDDGWHTLLAAGVDRNILVYDADATEGMFTKRLVSLMQTTMRRNAGGNSASGGRGRLTDLYVSPEALEDVRNWGMDQVDEVTRREIYIASENGAPITRIFGVNIHDLDELGEGQEYQEYYHNQLGGKVQEDDRELVIGLDRSTNDSFVMPMKGEVQVFEDPTLHRSYRVGYYGWVDAGFGVLDNRRIILGSF